MHSCNHCCSEKAITITFSEYVFVALRVQYAIRKRHIVICGLPALQYFSTLFQKGTTFGKVTEHIICVLILSTILPETFLILRRTEQDMFKKVYRSSCSVRHPCPIVMKLELSSRIFEKYSNNKFNENPSIGDRVVPYGRTDTAKLIDAFRNFANAPNILHKELIG